MWVFGMKFTDLSDSPASYVGHAGEAAVVGAAEDEIEFAAPSPGSHESTHDKGGSDALAGPLSLSDIEVKGPWADIRAYGAIEGGVVDNTTAFQAAVDAAAGGKVFIPKGSWKGKLSSVYPISIRGNKEGGSILIAPLASDDIITFGQDDANTIHFDVSDLTLSGGRYPLRLNNIQSSSFKKIYFTSNQTPIYMEGQIETCEFLKLYLDGFTQYGILTGQSNGGTNPSYNAPMFQKCLFDHIEFRGAAGALASLKLTAGVYLTVQQTSGFSSFRNIISQGNEIGVIDADFLTNTSFDHLENETFGTFAANTYSMIKLGGYCGHLGLTNFALAADKYKYAIEQLGGFITLMNVTIAPAGATADIYSDGRLTVINSSLKGAAASGFVFGAGSSGGKRALLINVVDGDGNYITDWPSTYPWITPNASGVLTGYLSCPKGLNVGGGGKTWDSLGDTFYDGVADEIVPLATGKRVNFRRTVDNLSLLKINSSDPSTNQSVIELLVNADGFMVVRRIRFGPVDSGGAGYRMVLIDN